MRKISIVVLIVLLVAAPFFVSCEKKYKIGDEGPAGGMIFYVDEEDKYPGWKYLETSTGKDGIGRYRFGYFYIDGHMETVGTETGVGAGRRNTGMLVAMMGDAAWDEDGNRNVSEYAAKKCSEYSVKKDGVVYDDWFLPSKDELDLVYWNLQKPGLVQFSGSWCWSSSEDDYYDGYTWVRDFGDGHPVSSHRYRTNCVRPVRAF